MVENITLHCLASGFPIPNITWLLNDSMIGADNNRITIMTTNSPDLIPGFSDDGFFLGSGFSQFNLGSGSATNIEITDPFGTVSSVLTIKRTVITDSGNYQCVAKNLEFYSEKESQSALVLVQGERTLIMYWYSVTVCIIII